MKTAILISLLVIPFSSLCQSRKKQIGLGTGWIYYAIKDQSVSSFTHSGSASPVIFFVKADGEKSKNHIQLSYASSFLTSSSNGFSTNGQIGYLQFAHHRKFRSKSNNILFFVGGLFDLNINFRQSSNYSGVSDINGELITSLSPSLLVELPMRKDLLSAQVWSSIMAVSFQAGYARSLPPQLNLLGISEFSTINWRMAFSKSLAVKWNLRFEYQFQLNNLRKFETLTSLSHQLTTSVIFKVN